MTSTGIGCKGHSGHDMNERADELARAGMAPFIPGGPTASARASLK